MMEAKRARSEAAIAVREITESEAPGARELGGGVTSSGSR